MELRLLGPLALLDDAGDVVDVRGTNPKSVLALLGLHPGEVVSSSRMIEALWGDHDVRDPLNAVQVAVSKIRRAADSISGAGGRPLVVTTASGYLLDADPDSVDVVRFERLAAEGRRQLDLGEPAAAAATLRAALDLWRGPVLEDFDPDFAIGDRTRLDDLRTSALELRIEAELALGRHDEAATELASLTVQHPLRERFRAQQMLALYRAGRQAEALRVYQATRAILADELGLDPSEELQRLEASILARDPALDVAHVGITDAERESSAEPRGRLLEPISSFVGRAAELAAVRQLLADNRLVTLVGTGGVGKTRLALEAARRAADDHEHGAYFVGLAPLREPAHVATTVASVLGVDDPARLERFLGNKDVVIVVDNCEHLVDEVAAVVERVLHAGAGVRVLATSREHLGIRGEVRWTVPTMDREEAAYLFRERARASGLDLDDSVAVDRICERLDGLPLAVELAAARTRSLGLDEIAERIDHRFRLLTTGDRMAHPRQQTLRRVVDWSYDLLLPQEQAVFRRLAVFAGGFDLGAAEAVCVDVAPADDVLDILGHLVDKSLVSVISRDSGTRYGLLQTLVDYGVERLVEAGEMDATRDRHLRWAVSFTEAAERGLRGTDQARWIQRLGHELDNARAALEWARRQSEVADAVALVAGLAYGWYITGSVRDGQELIVSALALDGAASEDHRAVAGAWGSWLTQIGSGATTQAVELSERSLAIGRVGSTRGFCIAAVIASLLRAYRGLTAEAESLIEEAAAALEEHPDRWVQSYVDWVQSGLVLKMGDADRALDLLHRAYSSFGVEGDRYGQAIVAIRLGELAELRGDLDEATTLTTFAYEGTTSSGPGANASILATRLGNLAALDGRFDEAAMWHGIGLSRARELVFPGPAAQAISGMAVAAALRDDLTESERLHREALAAYEDVGSVEGTSFCCAWLGFLATRRADVEAADGWLHRSLASAARGSERRAVAQAVDGLAGVAALRGDPLRAAELLGAASGQRASSIVLPSWLLQERARTEVTARSTLSSGEFDASFASGRECSDTIVADLVNALGGAGN